MKRVTKKKEVNLNTLNTGCSPCLNEAKKAERQIGNRKVSELKIDEIKKIVSSLFNNNK
mgnify:CR=1 FL=1|jgi:hypothetical protein|tara:strand:+ start:174 stop:350 length:177 start_codon:yes stop_codon:yes gene_type:complete